LKSVAAYCERIGVACELAPDLETLQLLHRSHLLAIPYENVDVQLEHKLDLDIDRIFRKLVDNRRGGWCYEMNGLLGWVLTEVGFKVTRVNGGVSRPVRGADAMGNHLVLLVELGDQVFLVDAGFGDGVLDPVPLTEGGIQQRGFEYRLEKLSDGYWRFHNHEHGGAPNFDFKEVPADELLFSEKCEYLQTSPESPFVIALVVQRFTENGYEVQIGKHARTISPSGVVTREIQSADELVDRLASAFGLEVPEIADIWPKICQRHEEHFGGGGD